MSKHAHISDGDIINIGGINFRVNFEPDYDSDPPWEDEYGHGPVRQSSYKHRDGQSDKRPGERPLCDYYYYDWAEACKLARRDGWGAPPYDAPDRVQRAVQADFDYLRAFIRGDWWYVGVTVTPVDEDGESIGEPDSVWGVETYTDYHVDFAHELAEGMAREMAREAIERAYWACRDVETV